MTEGWLPVETQFLKMEIPETWERLPSDDERVVAIAKPIKRWTRFRANVVIVVLESTETIEQMGARSIAEALAHPGWSHVCSDLEWRRPDITGRVVHFLYEAGGTCVSVARSGIVTGTHVVEITASCDVVDLLQYEELFTMIASEIRFKETT
ncbi:hypothetical protein [Clavibacter sp. CT19]|uniref:hypothetical protein n=1 Tax=unclassified Clavibacter TaxID=2626594 RepID=UPI0022EAB792|nr:hypothetical protein [Clavibacter sp. CT19]MDA3805342.1 hypothetical protein [Clavibacter sp. CT19]